MGDLQVHDPEDIPALLAKIEVKATDIASGWRKNRPRQCDHAQVSIAHRKLADVKKASGIPASAISGTTF